MTQLEAMVLTFVVEAATAALLAVLWFRVSPTRCALAAVAASAVTHPILWAVFHDVQGGLGAYTTPTLEFVIIAAESLAYRLLATSVWMEALLLSLFVNAASWGIGEAIYVFT